MKKIKRIGHDVVYMDEYGNQFLKYEPIKVKKGKQKKTLLQRLRGE